MTNSETGAAIDAVAKAILGEYERITGEKRDQHASPFTERLATAIVGELQSRFMLIPLPMVPDDDEREAAAMVPPGLFGHCGKVTA